MSQSNSPMSQRGPRGVTRCSELLQPGSYGRGCGLGIQASGCSANLVTSNSCHLALVTWGLGP